jgi:hypothetical protein
MARSRYVILEPDKPHFLTRTVVVCLPVFTLHRNGANGQIGNILLELLVAKLLSYRLKAVVINTVYVQAVLGQIDPHYLHFPSFAMLLHGLPRFIWLTGIANLAH